MATVLIADDNKQIVSVLTEYAKKEGHATHAAFDGQQALELFDKMKPDVVLLDVMMPKVDGFEVCRKSEKPPIRPSL
jgi:CheY-like chemotaxis protein